MSMSLDAKYGLPPCHFEGGVKDFDRANGETSLNRLCFPTLWRNGLRPGETLSFHVLDRGQFVPDVKKSCALLGEALERTAVTGLPAVGG